MKELNCTYQKSQRYTAVYFLTTEFYLITIFIANHTGKDDY
jgi:hypothetical protein